MSAPDYAGLAIPLEGWPVEINLLPTERLVAIVEQHNRMAEALIAIAVDFVWSCMSHGCAPDCPGLLARRALGVA